MTTVSTKPRVSEDELWVATNELGQAAVLKQLATAKTEGNAIFGCSGTYLLNLAAACEGVEYIRVFDCSEKVKEFWEGMQKIIPNLDPDKLEEAKNKFYEWVDANYAQNPYQPHRIISEWREGTSFLSSPEKLRKVQKIFQRAKGVTFTFVDLGNPKDFPAFIMAQRIDKVVPKIVYISNIAECTTGAISNTLKGIERCMRWKDFCSSLSHIPKEAIVIDAAGDPNSKSTQRIHLQDRVGLFPAIDELFKYVCADDDYEAATWCLQNGLDVNQILEVHGTKIPNLHLAARLGKLNIAMALLDHRADPNAPDANAKTPLSYAANEDQPEAIELLVSRKADVNVIEKQGKATPLYWATICGSVKAATRLLELGANRYFKDLEGRSLLEMLQHPKIVGKIDKSKSDQLFPLLANGCKPRNPRTFTAPAPVARAESKDNKDNKDNSEKADSKGAKS